MMFNGGMGKRFQHFIQQSLASGLVISFMLQLFARMHNIIIDEQRKDTTAGELKRSHVEGCA